MSPRFTKPEGNPETALMAVVGGTIRDDAHKNVRQVEWARSVHFCGVTMSLFLLHQNVRTMSRPPDFRLTIHL